MPPSACLSFPSNSLQGSHSKSTKTPPHAQGSRSQPAPAPAACSPEHPTAATGGPHGGTLPGPGAHPGKRRCGPGPAGRAGAARNPQPPRPSPPGLQRPRGTAPLRPAAPSACAPAPGLNRKGERGCDIRAGRDTRHSWGTGRGEGQRESCTCIVHLRIETWEGL